MGFGDFLSKGLTTAGKAFNATQGVMNKAGAVVGMPPIPSVAGKLAEKASALIQGKATAKVTVTAKPAPAVTSTTVKSTTVTPAPPKPTTATSSASLWQIIVKYWWVVLIAFVLIFFVFKKKPSSRRRISRAISRPITRRRIKQSNTGSDFAKRMRLAKLRKARARGRK